MRRETFDEMDARIAAEVRREELEESIDAPEYHRELTDANRRRLCTCGTRWHWHFDGWDGNRLDCAEAALRSGGR